jgi:hypothetical protein
MDLYIYETPGGTIADFRPYLDGRDHSFDDHRHLKPDDPRWEKIQNLRDPDTDDLIGGKVEFLGKSTIVWHELMRFPIPWRQTFEPVAWRPTG